MLLLTLDHHGDMHLKLHHLFDLKFCPDAPLRLIRTCRSVRKSMGVLLGPGNLR